MKPIFVSAIFFALIFEAAFSFAQNQDQGMKNEDRIKPWAENPRYWQYKGQPLLLLGGSKTDHLFLAEGLLDHLDEIQVIRANYLRNTMSQHEGKGLKAHLLLANGKFDINNWNPEKFMISVSI
jgi:hypothetical protein